MKKSAYAEEKKSIKEYVELEAGERVISIILKEEIQFGGEVNPIFLVKTDENKYYVIRRDAMNLYDVSKFNSADEAFSFHIGLMMRVRERQAVIEENKQ